MEPEKRYEELLKKRNRVKQKLADAKKRLGHPHDDWQSAHDLAESEYKVYIALLEDIETEISKLERDLGR